VLVPGRPQGEYLLFCRERDAEAERWLGAHAGLEAACEAFGADDAFPISDLDDILPGLLETRPRVYYAMGSNPDFDHRMLGWLNRMRHSGGAASPSEIAALDHLLHDMRLYKSSAEQKLMRQAVELSGAAHRRAMARCRPGMYEYQLEAELLYAMHAAGCRSPAYPSIVAGGANACVLHYTANSELLAEGDLVLVDAGAEFEHYASDITRTYPVSGRFSPPQRDLYEVVLAAQTAAIEAVRPGAVFEGAHRVAAEVVTEGLVSLGLLSGEVSGLVEREAYARFFMHSAGHWLGIDVHDVGDYRVGGAPRVLEPGMAVTIEPGVYVAPDDETVEPHWRGIGIRIEDDVVVTREGNEVLSAGIPKAVAELEALVGSEAAA
jgi:Xaa-Pro aminopeptidase